MTTYFIISVILMVVFLVISIIEDKRLVNLANECKRLQSAVVELKMEREINCTAQEIELAKKVS